MAEPKPTVAPLPLLPLKGNKAEFVELRKLLFLNWLSPFLRKQIKYVPRTSHTNTLGSFEHFAQQEPAAKTVTLVVGNDSGEYALSEIAGRHWIEVGLSALAERRKDFATWIRGFGFELAVRPLDETLGPHDRPLVEVMFEGKPWLVAAVFGEPSTVICDSAVGPPSFAALDAAGRSAIAAAAKGGVCACFLCASLRANGSKRSKTVKASKPKPAEPTRPSKRRT